MPTAKRMIAIAAALLISQSIPLAAQFEIGGFGGAHNQRSRLMERHLRYGTANQVNDRGTGFAFGVVAGFALNPIFRLELQILSSRNGAWRIIPGPNNFIPPSSAIASGFNVRKTIINPRFTLVPLTRSRLELRVSGGLARISRSGSGESTLDEDSSLGGALTGGVLLAISEGASLVGEGSFLAYSGKIQNGLGINGIGAALQTPTVGQSDFIATVGLRARFGKRPSRGTSHGPAVVPQLD